ncbi:MAG: hypothetical protein ABI193_15410, partial [Minicystis sp.]
MSAGLVEERIARLEAAGAQGFDALGLGQLRSLVARAEGLGEGARALLAPRIEARLQRFEEALLAARAQAEEALASLGAEREPALSEALDRGDFQAVQRGVQHRLRERATGQQLVSIGWIPRLRAQAAARGLHLDDALEGGLGALDRTPGFVERRSLG